MGLVGVASEASCVGFVGCRLVVLSVLEHQDRVVDLEGGAEFYTHDLDDVALGQQQQGLPVNLLLEDNQSDYSMGQQLICSQLNPVRQRKKSLSLSKGYRSYLPLYREYEPFDHL